MSGGISVSKIDVCTWRYTASVSGGSCPNAYVSVGGNHFPSTQTPSCSWADPETPEFWSGIALADGEFVDVTHPVGCWTYFYTVHDGECSCAGPQNSGEVCCDDCDCCHGTHAGMSFTVSGIGGNPENPGPNTCDCSELNISGFAERVGDCFGSVRTEVDIHCTESGTYESEIYVCYQIICGPIDDVEGYFLQIQWEVLDPGGTASGHMTEWISLEKPQCDEMATCIESGITDAIGRLCGYENMTICGTVI